MLEHTRVVQFLGTAAVVSPLLLVFILGIPSLLGRKISEERTTRFVQAGTVFGLLAAIAVLVLMFVNGTWHVAVELGDWVFIPGLYHFSVKFVFDRLSVPFAIMSFVLTGTIGAFASRYLHREPGFNRFFMLYTIFVAGMVLTSLAGTIETLFAGWEMVGLSSALLVNYYHERPAPARNGLWVWSIYRVSDAALLLAAVAMHHMRGEGDFDVLLGGGSWPEGQAAVTATQAFVVGILLLVAAAGKSALVPFSGWLPRAMEGPTPSSAVYYGALSVHLGAFLLLRVSPLLAFSSALSLAVVVLGLTTAVYAYFVGSVQTDIKSALSFASLTQVGIIVAEVGLVWRFAPQWRYVPLIHILGHGCLRTFQFVRAPTLLHDYHTLENAIGEHLPAPVGVWGRMAARQRSWVYRFALERGYLDGMLMAYIVTPFIRVFRWCDANERRFTDFVSGEASRESDAFRPHTAITIEDFS